MAKRMIDVSDYANHIMKSFRPGVLITTKAGEKINSMVIGWGTLGVIWERPVFIAYVRDCRYTREMLDKNPEFTINVPMGSFDKKILAVCGTKSGRDMDKISAANLTPVPPEVISVPGIKEFPLTLECRALYREEQESERLPDEIKRKFYTVETHDHIAFYGEIKAAYIIE
ncbi:MAG: flavin reductase family protein [Clostridia bacterium]|nr:flavin reductase family protein [Clostridia bacterium]